MKAIHARRILAALLFLVLVNEGDPTTLYAKPVPDGFSPTGFAPFGWVQSFLLDPLPIKVRPFDLVVLLVLLAARKAPGAGARVRPMRNALLLGVGTIVLWFVYGVVTGGDARAASWQVYLLLSAILYAFTVSAVFVAPEHYETITNTVIAAGLYRAVMCWWFYWSYIAYGHFDVRPEYVTAHDDTVVWVIAIIAMVVRAITARKAWTTVRAVAVNLFLVGAIQWNTRRLAWVSLFFGLVTLFFLLPKGRIKARVQRAAMYVAPVILLYVAVGWGRPERIFSPLQSLASVSTQEDRSTKARNAENLGLIETVHRANPLTGTGWGHGYVAVTDKYSIAKFMELWPYVPHNSVLGLLAYTGVLGFIGYWLAFPTAVFLNARLAKLAPDDRAKSVGMVCSTLMIVCGNQMYGDMGIFSLRTMYLLATTYGMALRLPAVAGVWPGAAAKKKATTVEA